MPGEMGFRMTGGTDLCVFTRSPGSFFPARQFAQIGENRNIDRKRGDARWERKGCTNAIGAERCFKDTHHRLKEKDTCSVLESAWRPIVTKAKILMDISLSKIIIKYHGT